MKKIKSGRWACLITWESTTTLSIGTFSDFVSFSTRIEIPGFLVGKIIVISCSGKLLGLFDPLLLLRVPLKKVDYKPAAR